MINLVLNSVLLWVPTYMTEAASTSVGNWKVLGYPIVGALGILLAGRLYDRFHQRNQARLLIPILLILSGGLLAFSLTAPNSLGNISALIVVGLSVTAANFVITGPIYLQIGGEENRAATAGIIDGIGYLGSAVGTLATGWLIQHSGWHPALMFWIGAAVAGCLGAVGLAAKITPSPVGSKNITTSTAK
jgi:sugar phosphate permease